MTPRTIEQIAREMAGPVAPTGYFERLIREAVANETATLRAQLEAERAVVAQLRAELVQAKALALDVAKASKGGV